MATALIFASSTAATAEETSNLEASSQFDSSPQVEVEEIQGVSDGGEVTFETEGSTLTVLPATQDAPEDLEAMASVISCDLLVHNVHGSSHVNGRINGQANIACNGAMGKLQLHYSIIRLSDNMQWAAPSKTNSGASSLKTQKDISCSQGYTNMRAWAQGVLTPPPGYTLVGPALAEKYGNTTFVACGPGILSDSANDTSDVLSVTFVRNDLL